MTEDGTGRHSDAPTTDNKVTTGSLGASVQATQVDTVNIHPPAANLHSYLWALLGAVLVLCGVVVMAWGLRDSGVEGTADSGPTAVDSTTRDQPTTTTEPTTTEPTTTTPEPTTTTSPPPRPTIPAAAPVQVWWEGSVKLLGDGGPRSGWFFDYPEPQAGFAVGDLAYGDATSVTSDKVADWEGDVPPGQAQCADLLRATAGNTRASARRGNTFCFTTRGKRIGYATVTGTSPADPLDPSISLQVVVWDLR
ncbi:hypothetical protein ALI22I_19420 [Saccharothrix sp. ALI-22-I]|uniref:hypothetical protein n=1 Tax=Saccharothrix sp. ALI-22-I TaxID=1933778 RepID=UPI00097BDA3C|nr:hypothetical protein [Saccharothrix sp. ALI-22-I]ONI88516.1 hypothetical protein ALI22I_19420 [Saccharothrix sp. ALI-22-I]